MVVVAALGSAVAAATSSVLQHRSARTAPVAEGRRLRLLAHLVAHPVWLAGTVAAIVGLALHAVALAGGNLALVQPLMVSGLLFALPVSVLLERRRPSLREWGWGLLVVVALSAFLLAARPSGGMVSLDADTLAITVVVTGAAVAITAGAALWWAPTHRAALLAAAAGGAYGMVAALLKETTALWQTGIGHTLSDWPFYALLLAGAVAIALTQQAYRAGPLASSMPALTISDPLVSVAIGALAFDEELVHTPLALFAEVAAFAVMTVACIQLTRLQASRIEPFAGAPTS